MKKSKREKITEINIIDQDCPIPLESLAVLVSGESNTKFRTISKQILAYKVKVRLKHRESGERLVVTVPIEFLEFHRIFYRDPVIPTNKQLIGVLEGKVRDWEVQNVVKDYWVHHDLVVVKCMQSGRIIACKIPVEDIEKTKLYIEKSINKNKYYGLEKINIWREQQCRNEIQMAQNLLRSTSTRILQKV